MDPLDELCGTSPPIVALRERVRHVVALGQRSGRLPPVLLQGETGTGKGLLTRLIHRAGPRAAGPFVDVNCAAIPETMLEAELFGFERGAFTDARHAKPGLIRTAHGGTLFLDEVDLLAPALQAKLLTALEERVVRPLGSTHAEPVDVWVVAATNQNLEGEVRARRFREDLYHRLAVLTLTLPPLRERREDIVLLAEHLLARGCADYRLPPKQLSVAARAALQDYPWPGNVRELGNVIERGVLLAAGPLIAPEILGLPSARPAGAGERALVETFESIEDHITSIERRQMLEALRTTDWNISRAARQLGVPRHWLRYRMEKYRLLQDAASGASAAEASPPEPARPAATRAPAPHGSAPAVRWEPRHLAFLGAAVCPAGPGSSMGQELATVVEKVQAFGGQALDVGSSTVTAAFGLEPIENAPATAALAAIAMLKAAERARRDDPRAPAVAVVIHVTPVMIEVVDADARIDARDRQAASTALSALLAATEPDSIAVSAATVPFLDRRFDLAPADGAPGAEGPLHRLTLRESARFHLGARPLTPFVGREHELAILGERLGQAVRGHGQVVGVVGEPGVGKSRFVYELVRSEGARPRVLYGRAVSANVATPWLPITELLKHALDVDDSDSPLQVREKATTATRARGLEAHLPALLALLDVPVDDPAWHALDPRGRRQRLVESAIRLLLHDSEQEPLLVLIEDLHWADTETRAFLDRLVDRLPAAAILLVVTCRLGLPLDWGGKTYYTQLRLDALAPPTAAQMLEALLGHGSGLGELKDVLIARTEGNPLFIEESVHSLVETGALAGERGAFSLTRGTPRIEVPATVQAILAARIDRLPAAEKRLLQSAAVVGKDIPLPLLREIAEGSEDDLRRGLSHLQAAEFLYEVGLGPAYTFKHVLTHEVSYASLREEMRRDLHARLVGASERLYADRMSEHVERLAHHAAAGEVWDKAVRYLGLAGRRAAERSANREAVDWFERALSALERLPAGRHKLEQSVDLRLDMHGPMAVLGRTIPLAGVLADARRLAEALGDGRRLARVLAYLANILTVTGEYERAIESGEAALAIPEARDDLAVQFAARTYMGMARWGRGEFDRVGHLFHAQVHALAGVPIGERFGMPGLAMVYARGWDAFTMAELGRFAEGEAAGSEALGIAREAKHRYSQVFAALGLCYLYDRKGDFGQAIRVGEDALVLSRADVPHLFPMLAAYVGLAYAGAGRPEASELLREADELSARFNRWRSLVLSFLADAHAHLRRLDEAHRFAEAALERGRANQARPVQGWMLRLLADIHARGPQPDPDPAERGFLQALAIADELGMRPLAAHCQRGLAALYRRTGRIAEARDRLELGRMMYREMDMRFWLARAEDELARPA